MLYLKHENTVYLLKMSSEIWKDSHWYLWHIVTLIHPFLQWYQFWLPVDQPVVYHHFESIKTQEAYIQLSVF